MKSVIVANDFLTTLVNDVSKLTRGQAVLLNSAGKVVAADSDVKDDEMLQFVLGLGDGIFFPLAFCHPFLSILEVLFIVELGIRGQNLIDTVSRTAPILTRSHIGNDL